MLSCPRCGRELETVFTIEENEYLTFDVVHFEICRRCRIGFKQGIIETFDTYEEAEQFIYKDMEAFVEDLSDYALLP